MRDKIKVVICAGGTGGHIYPGIAVAQQLKKDSPDSRVLFFSTGKSIEDEIFSFYRMKHIRIKSSGFMIKKGFLSLLSSTVLFFTASVKSFICLYRFRPNVVLCTGGYLTLPVSISSWVLRIPVILHEQNALPGKANMVSKFFARTVAVTFEESMKYFGSKAILCGNPLRETIAFADKTI